MTGDRNSPVASDQSVDDFRARFDRRPEGERRPAEVAAWAEVDRLRASLEQIRALWTDPAPAQRQDVAFQEAVRIASEALGSYR